MLQLCWAGGPAALIARAGGTIEKVSGSGMPLGFMEGLTYNTQRYVLEPGDAVLVFTDGAFEIHSAQNKLLEVDGLVDILRDLHYPAHTLDSSILEEKLLEYSNDIRPPDDLTIIEIVYAGRTEFRNVSQPCYDIDSPLSRD